MDNMVIPLRRIHEAIHYAGFAKPAWSGQQYMPP